MIEYMQLMMNQISIFQQHFRSPSHPTARFESSLRGCTSVALNRKILRLPFAAAELGRSEHRVLGRFGFRQEVNFSASFWSGLGNIALKPARYHLGFEPELVALAPSAS